ncbi:4-fold beta flower protein [Vibrio genomosp. F10]|uniref:4-fold beta flower domain-containing protein n=2 Tax=Vibrio genomosp. F10 TaxID=723171 RepID=A0A1B9R2F3_9VIBR|nr:hypothetical protein [Vibrio genomosp. F10]OCH78507.1 hypothetical protein A6E14_17555 [Vibrio genomosp. F10]OEE35947.1 hypothetical protein A1QO_19205 [Vibrio genomosp. F10 str. ZF-129]OEE92980.1 hypothetical protein A1QM_10940 [Vibrio genomosp. F10 str. 9ZC157]OEF06492.1 hypothetical protein A1QI_05960 [Vibrio genomosp. F10 str. 9ZB36]
MKSVWTWGGKSFGYIDGEDLWTNQGKHIAKLVEGEIYGPEGQYLGELMDHERLIFSQAKKALLSSPFKPYADQAPIKPCTDFASYAMFNGYEEFHEA